MTQTGLPRRPFLEVPPPPGGLDDVRRAARFRRRRRAAVAAGGSSVLAVVVVLVMLLGGGGGVDVLKTVQPAVTPTPAAGSPAISAPATPHSVRPAGTPASAEPVGQAGTLGGAVASTGAVHSSPAAVSQPQLVRTQRTDTGAGQVEFCSESVNVDAPASQPSVEHNQEVGWCFAAVAHRVTSGEQLTVDLCRDSTGSGTLTFDTTREVDLTVQRNGKTVWDWARDHPARSDQHQLTAASHDCWDWTLVWPDINQSGANAGHGTFTFVATSTAKELSTGPTQTTTFRL
ncbi:MAG TPA: hypothetical protein VFH54_09190 [Mycobacteriales bacterium]|nr:hypothetical protein [Mycobacteriales bacterium]